MRRRDAAAAHLHDSPIQALPCEWTTPKLQVVHAQRPAILMVTCKLMLQHNQMHMVVLGLLYHHTRV